VERRRHPRIIDTRESNRIATEKTHQATTDERGDPRPTAMEKPIATAVDAHQTRRMPLNGHRQGQVCRRESGTPGFRRCTNRLHEGGGDGHVGTV